MLFVNGHLPPAARIRPGMLVVLVDLSGTGALFESAFRFRTGHRCELQIGALADHAAVAARVTRCFVARVEPSMIRYRTAVEFDRRIPMSPRGDLLAEYSVPGAVHGPPPEGVGASRSAREFPRQ
jgi:hypothetical protein